MSIFEDDVRASFLRYITGQLPDMERQRFEERLMQDQGFSDATAVCEQELIDSYVLNQLNEAERDALGSWIKASPNRQKRVEFARALLQPRQNQSYGRRKMFFALAAAACLLAAVTLYLANRTSLERKQATAASTIATVTAPPSMSTDKTASVSEASKPDVILVAPERLRGEQKTGTYQVHRESPIELQILLPESKERGGYSLRVMTETNPKGVLVRKTGLEAQSMGGQLYLSVALPKGSLPPATYLVTVSRQGDSIESKFTLRWSNE